MNGDTIKLNSNFSDKKQFFFFIINCDDLSVESRNIEKQKVIIGRSTDSEIVLNNPLVSKIHCKLEACGNSLWQIVDLKSTNKTYVNGLALKSKKYLKNGDILRIGSFLLIFKESSGDFKTGHGELLDGYSDAVKNISSVLKQNFLGTQTVLITGENGTGKHFLVTKLADYFGYRPVFAKNFGSDQKWMINFLDEIKSSKETQNTVVCFHEVTNIPITLQQLLVEFIKTDDTLKALNSTNSAYPDTKFVFLSDIPSEELYKQENIDDKFLSIITTFEIKIPPLRERKEDIFYIFKQEIEKIFQNKIPHFSSDFIEYLLLCDYQNNIYDLKKIINSISLNRKTVYTVFDIKKFSSTPLVQYDEKQKLISLLKRCNGNISKVAKHMGTSRTTVYEKLKKFGIDAEFYRKK